MTDEKRILLIGGGGHAESLIDAAGGPQKIYGILDKDRSRIGETICGVRIIGSDEDLETVRREGVGSFILAVGHVGNYRLRKDLFQRFVNAGFEPVNVIHPTAWVSPYAKIGKGNAVLAGAVINAGAVLGDNNIVNTHAVVEHDTVCGNNVHFAPGSVVCGGSRIGSDSLIGAGAVVIQGITVGERVLVGAGSAVIRNLPDGVQAVGTPARARARES